MDYAERYEFAHLAADLARASAELAAQTAYLEPHMEKWQATQAGLCRAKAVGLIEHVYDRLMHAVGDSAEARVVA